MKYSYSHILVSNWVYVPIYVMTLDSELSKRHTLVLSNTRELDRVPITD